MPSGVITSLPPSLEFAVHLRVPAIRAPLPCLADSSLLPSCGRTIRHDAAPSCNPFAPAPVATLQPQPILPAAAGRFDLVVPTSLLESSLDVHTVLQRGVTVVFRTASGLSAAHGVVTRRTNPLGLTSYRVSGQQPAGMGAGCSVLGWGAEAGCLVVSIAAPQAQQQGSSNGCTKQVPTPAPAPRLFANLLPSPVTIRKQTRPQAQPEPAAQPCFFPPFTSLSSLARPQATAQPQLQSQALPVPVSKLLAQAQPSAHASAQALPAPASKLLAQQQAQPHSSRPPALVLPASPKAPPAQPHSATSSQRTVCLPLPPAYAARAEAQAQAQLLVSMPEPSRPAASTRQQPPAGPASLLCDEQSGEDLGEELEQPLKPYHSSKPQSARASAPAAAAVPSGRPRRACRAAAGSALSQGGSASEAEAEAPSKRPRRAASLEQPKAQPVAAAGAGSEAVGLAGIDLLLAAGEALRQQEAGGRGKRTRVLTKTLSL